MTKIINFFAGPGAGKSTAATGLFSQMKNIGINCEYVSEYAKDVTWEETHKLLENQLHITSEQFRRQIRLKNKVDYVITDSPLMLGVVYLDHHETKEQIFSLQVSTSIKRLIHDLFNEFDNINILIDRKKKYNPIGRNQTESDAKLVDDRIRIMLKNYQIPVHLNTNSQTSIQDSLNFLEENYGIKRIL